MTSETDSSLNIKIERISESEKGCELDDFDMVKTIGKWQVKNLKFNYLFIFRYDAPAVLTAYGIRNILNWLCDFWQRIILTSNKVDCCQISDRSC